VSVLSFFPYPAPPTLMAVVHLGNRTPTAMPKKSMSRPAFTEELMDKKQSKKYAKATAAVDYYEGECDARTPRASFACCSSTSPCPPFLLKRTPSSPHLREPPSYCGKHLRWWGEVGRGLSLLPAHAQLAFRALLFALSINRAATL
jgi:hypothetical protein